MKQKIWLIVAACLMVVGLAVCAAGFAMADFEFKELSTQNMQTNTHVVNERFSHIRLECSTADITFLPAQDDKVTVTCYEDEKSKHTVQVEKDTLTIVETSERKWYDYIGIQFATASVTVYLPAGAYETVQIDCSTGNVTMPADFHFAEAAVELSTGDVLWQADEDVSLSIEAATGRITTEGVLCGELHVSTTTGKVRLRDTRASGKLQVSTSTGNVMLENVDGGELDIETSTGNVSGNLLSDKIFIANTSTGKVVVPDSTTGGKCEVNTSTGDIRLEISK